MKQPASALDLYCKMTAFSIVPNYITEMVQQASLIKVILNIKYLCWKKLTRWCNCRDDKSHSVMGY